MEWLMAWFEGMPDLFVLECARNGNLAWQLKIPELRKVSNWEHQLNIVEFQGSQVIFDDQRVSGWGDMGMNESDWTKLMDLC